jgi:hypothetical protein
MLGYHVASHCLSEVMVVSGAMLSLVRSVVVLALSCFAYGKITIQSPLALESLGRNVVLGEISYFVPGWPEVSCSTAGVVNV